LRFRNANLGHREDGKGGNKLPGHKENGDCCPQKPEEIRVFEGHEGSPGRGRHGPRSRLLDPKEDQKQGEERGDGPKEEKEGVGKTGSQIPSQGWPQSPPHVRSHAQEPVALHPFPRGEIGEEGGDRGRG
jgi:hypothetical protein